MNDLRQDKVFRASAFQPTEEELKAATRRKYADPRGTPKYSGAPSGSVQKPATASFTSTVFPDLSDSDDDLPDTSTLIKNLKLGMNNKGKGKATLKNESKVSKGSDDDVR